MAMLAEHRNRLREKRIELLTHMQLRPDFCAYFTVDNTLTEEMVAEIMEPPIYTRRERVAKLLDRLPARGACAFTRLMEALIQTEQEALAQSLDPDNILLQRDEADTGNAVNHQELPHADANTDVVLTLIEINYQPKFQKLRNEQLVKRGDYDLGRGKVGNALIASFTTGNVDRGLERDIQVLNYVFSELKFNLNNIQVTDDSDLYKKLKAHAETLSDGDKAFVLYVLRCPESVKSTAVQKIFDVEACKALEKKPKIFFLQKPELTSNRMVAQGEVQKDSETGPKMTDMYIVTIRENPNPVDYSEMVISLAHTFAEYARFFKLTKLVGVATTVFNRLRKKRQRPDSIVNRDGTLGEFYLIQQEI